MLKKKKRIELDDEYISNDDDNFYSEYMHDNDSSTEKNNSPELISQNNMENNDFINQNNNQDNFVNTTANMNENHGYVEKEYKTNTLEENTQITKASSISRFILIGFYVFAIVIAVVLFFMIRSNKYEYYLKNDSILLDSGSSYQVELLPKNERYFDYLNYKYSIADENVAKVDEYGTVTAVGSGTTTLKISLKPGLTNIKTIKVITEQINVESVSIGVVNDNDLTVADSYQMGNNQSITLKAVANNREDLNVSAKYTSSNPSVASVDSFGNVTAKHDGTTIITSEINGIVGTITITVDSSTEEPIVNPLPVVTPNPDNPTAKPTSKPTAKPNGNTTSKVSLGIASQTIKYVGDKLQLKATVNNKNVDNSTVKWTSSKVGVATISNTGLIKCNAVGTTVITAEVNGVKASATIIVKSKPTTQPTQAPTNKPSTTTPPSTTAKPESTFNSKYVKFSTQSITINKGQTAKITVKLYNAAGLFNVKSSNTAIATVDKATVWLDGVSEDDGKAYWAEKDIVVTGVKAGTTTVVITDSDAGIGTYDEKPLDLNGKHVVNIIVK